MNQTKPMEGIPMRMRRKPWARPELAACPFCIDEPALLRGHWKEHFARPDQPLVLELGCGKGGFAAAQGLRSPEKNLIAVDIKSEVLVMAKRKIEEAYRQAGRAIDNVVILSQEIELIDQILSEQDVVERIYINFCNPWPKKRCWKHRLTHTKQLNLYRKYLIEGGEIEFKTDDDMLYEASLEYFSEAGYHILETVWDLPADHPAEEIVTEHERMFRSMGMPIHYIRAKKETV